MSNFLADENVPTEVVELAPHSGPDVTWVADFPLLANFSFLVILLATSAGCPAEARAAADHDRPPNVVLIIADDMGYLDFGFMGHRQIHTPRLDRLARESLSFRRGYVTSSLCSPSLASILSGRYPHQHKITSNDPPLPQGVAASAAARHPAFLASRREMIQNFDEMPTLPRVLAASGFKSFEAGKWWGGSFERGGFTHGMTHGDADRGGRHGDLGLAIGRQGMQPAFDFIDMAQKLGAPFFLWYAPMMPHSPHNPPERLFARYRNKAPTLEIAKYWAMCEWFDETCGQLLDALENRKIADNTILIFLADNGWIQDPEADRYAPRSKQSPYDGGLRTPILVRWPGKVVPRMCDTPVSAIDIAPTVLKAAGVETPSGLPGVNLLDEKAVAGRIAIFGEVFTHNAVDIHDPASSLRYRWVISGDWKLIVPDRRNEPMGVVELFDVAHDPEETRNLAAEQPERVVGLTDRLDKWWAADRR
jgi:arylsulfatase A-like enzyme